MTTSTRRRLPEPMQQCASGDGLNRFAQSHLVRQQRAFREGQVQHAFALVGKERHLGFVRRPFAALHVELVVAPELFALRIAAPRFQPRRHLLRNPQFRHIRLNNPVQSFHGVFDAAVEEDAIVPEPFPQGLWQRTIPMEQPQRAQCRIGKDIQPRGALPGRGPEQPLEPPIQIQQHRFDVLARAEPVDPKIHAVARELRFPQITDLDGISQAAAGFDAKVREYWVTGIAIGNNEPLVASPLPATVDFIRIRGAPVVGGRDRDIPPALGLCDRHPPILAKSARESKPGYWHLSTAYSQAGQRKRRPYSLMSCRRLRLSKTPPTGTLQP